MKREAGDAGHGRAVTEKLQAGPERKIRMRMPSLSVGQGVASTGIGAAKTAAGTAGTRSSLLPAL